MTVRNPLVLIPGGNPQIQELPAGDTLAGAAQGIAATIAVGTVTSGVSASVTNSGTSSSAIFDFVLPKGDTGATGTAGAGVLAGGTAGQVLSKIDSTDYNTQWTAVAPVSASYVTLATNATLTSERVLTAGTGISITDGGAGSTVTIATSGSSSGALILLEQHTASSSASLNFTTWYSATYDDYVIRIVTLVPASAAQTVTIRFSTDGGSTYDSGNNYGWSTLESSSSGSGVGGNQTTSGIGLMRNLATTANYSSSGNYSLYNPAGSGYKDISGIGSVHTGTGAESQTATGIYRVTTAVNAFQVLMSSGNIASGTVRIYGVTK